MIQLNNLSEFFNRTLLKNTITGVCFALTLPLWTSCNNDLFIDEFLAQDVSQTVSCGDSAVVKFKGSNWNVLSVGTLLGTSFTVKSYDSEGNILTKYPQYGYPGMARMEAENEYNYLEIERVSARELKIRPLEMMHETPFRLNVLVGNEYEQRTLWFTINPSLKYQVDSVAYDWDTFETYDNELKVVNSIMIDNRGSAPMTYFAYPYKNGVKRTIISYWDLYNTYDLLKIDQDERVTVPDVENGRPVLRDTQIPISENGNTIELPLNSFDPNLSVPVVIDPHDKRYVIIYHKMETYAVSCKLYTSHPISHRKTVYQGMLHSARPYGYLIVKLKENQL